MMMPVPAPTPSGSNETTLTTDGSMAVATSEKSLVVEPDVVGGVAGVLGVVDGAALVEGVLGAEVLGAVVDRGRVVGGTVVDGANATGRWLVALDDWMTCTRENDTKKTVTTAAMAAMVRRMPVRRLADRRRGMGGGGGGGGGQSSTGTAGADPLGNTMGPSQYGGAGGGCQGQCRPAGASGLIVSDSCFTSRVLRSRGRDGRPLSASSSQPVRSES
jgi:hypothetical protein